MQLLLHELGLDRCVATLSCSDSLLVHWQVEDFHGNHICGLAHRVHKTASLNAAGVLPSV